MYHSANVLSQIFANPPYYILNCSVASENESEVIVVKGNIPGRVNRGTVFTFQGKRKLDKNKKQFFEVTQAPINPKFLKGTALTRWSEWSSPELQASTELISDLISSGVPVKIVNELWRELKHNPQVINENPWCLIYKGVDFKDTDAIARSLLGDKFSFQHHNRLKACVFWSLTQGLNNGHCFLNSNVVFRDVAVLSGVNEPKKIGLAIKEMVDEGLVIIEKLEGQSSNSVYLKYSHQMEVDLVGYVKTPLREKSEISISDETIKSYTRYDLTPTQVQAIKQGLIEPFSIVTGLPGTGKTTILSTLCKILADEGEEILLVAPTGIAAKRAQSLTGVKAYTIHRAFGAGIPLDKEEADGKSDYEGIKEKASERDKSSTIDPRKMIWKYDINNQRTESVIIIDESSMVDLHLMWRIMRGISLKCRVVMVGDIAQLPPVGAGFMLSEFIESGVLPRVHLTEVFRQGDGSGVTSSAHDVHNGIVPTTNEDFKILERSTERQSLETLISMCKELHLDDVDFHVVSPTHHGELGVTNLNKFLRTALNPDIGGGSLKIGGDVLREGDRIMITKNDYDLEVFNGDVGKIHHISKGSVEVIIKGSSDQLVAIPREQVYKILRLAYATTVHKSQGLEYEVILMPMSNSLHSNLLKRSVLYTAITRAKDKVYLIGDQNTLANFTLNIGNDEEGQNSSKSVLSLRLRS